MPSLVFSGTDKEECRAFVREIRKRAFAQGKENDSDWMIRLAISCFAGNALEWYVTLAGEVQNEWRLLEKAILIDYPLPPTLALLSRYTNSFDEESKPSESDKNRPVLAFTGKDKDDCRSFVQHIRLVASGEGKKEDSTWIAKLAYPCFSGKALDWYASLPLDVQQDWRRLERAILLDFPVQPTLAIAPARIHIADWYWRIRPSASVLGLKSREDWLAQARERRRMYLEAKDKSIPCWLLVESEADIPDNAIPTGPRPGGGADYSARAWQEHFGLVVGKCNRGLDGEFLD
ncbi:hypothetical protein FRC00_012111 [Tulasnella sp. 408]|nr:hypothetical protein FRC00_012111 [Tulasnella sp. 408]